MSFVPSIKCPECGVRIPMDTAEAKYTFVNLRCMGCAAEEFIKANPEYKVKPSLIDQPGFLEKLKKAFVDPSEIEARKQQADIIVNNLNTEAIMRAIDKALDEGNKDEFIRLTNLLKGGDAQK